MPRDSNGTYTLAEPPVQSAEPIAVSWANPSFDDFAAAFTDSLSRSGDGGMLVPFLNVDGTLAAPGMAWSNERGSGFYRFGPGDFRAVINGVPVTRHRDDTGNPPGAQNPFQIWDGVAWSNALTVTYNGQLLFGGGSAGAPTYAFDGSPASGYWSSAPDTLNWSINGVNKAQLNATAFTLDTPLELTNVLPTPVGLRDGALAYNGAGGLALKVGSAFVTIPAVAPANNGNLIPVATPVTSNSAALDGVYNYIDTRLNVVEMAMPVGVVGMRWGYIDFYRQFATNNCVLVPDGADLIEGVNENYEMNLQGASGVMRFTADRGWVDTGGMS